MSVGPPPTPVLDAVWQRAQQHLYDMGERRVYVTVEEFDSLRRESDALEYYKATVGLLHPPRTGEIGNFLGFDVIVGEPGVPPVNGYGKTGGVAEPARCTPSREQE